MNAVILTPARFAKILTAAQRSDTDVAAIVAHLTASGARFRTQRAQWFVTRVDTDNVSTDDAAAEVGITSGRVSQIATPLRRLIASGIPITDVDDSLYAHVYAIAKSGNGASQRIKDHVDVVSAIADLSGKRDAWFTLAPSDPKPRTPRPNDGSQTTEETSASAPASNDVTVKPSTWMERLHALVLEAATAPIGDLDLAMEKVNELSDLISDRVTGDVTVNA